MPSGSFQKIQIKHADWPFILWPFAALLGLAAALGWFWGMQAALLGAVLGATLLVLATAFHLYRLTRRDLEDQQRKTQAITYLNHHLGLREPLPYLASWAATPELALEIHKRIRTHKPNLIVELGSGTSTLICGYTLQGMHADGRVVSFDHDAVYAAHTRVQIAQHGLQSYCTVVDAPLTDVSVNNQQRRWYDLDRSVLSAPIDLLIVDGPPEKTQPLARYPALPLLHEHLSDDAVILVHDTHRPDESAAIKRWLQAFPSYRSVTLDTEKGITVLQKAT